MTPEATKPRPERRLKNAERGQSLVEFAIGSIILIILMSGLLDLGRLWYLYVALEDAAGEAALYLSLDPFCIDEVNADTGQPYTRPDGTQCTNPNNAMYRAKHAVGPNVLNWDLLHDPSQNRVKIVLPVDGAGKPVIAVGEPVSVTLEYPVELLTPIVPRFTGINPITLRSTATQTVIRVYQDNR